MIQLKNISHFIYLLFHDSEFSEIMMRITDYDESVLEELNRRFTNIDKFNINDIYDQIRIKKATINSLIDKHGKFDDVYKKLILKEIYARLYFHDMHPDEIKSDRKAGMGSNVTDFNTYHIEQISTFLVDLNHKVLCNELKNYEQASQAADLFVSQLSGKYYELGF